jgi:AcrR family transcriptional regulator
MPRVALQADDIAAFRRRATEAATRLFAAHGYDAVTMRAVADELGVSAMTPYRYVTGKDELFALVRAAAFRRFAERLEGSGGRVSDPLARLRRLKKAYVQFAVDEADAYRIMFELRQPEDAARSAELDAQSRRAFGCLHDAVRAAVEAGALAGDPLTVAHLLWASTHGLVSLHLAGRLSARSLEQLAAVDHELAGFRRKKP